MGNKAGLVTLKIGATVKYYTKNNFFVKKVFHISSQNRLLKMKILMATVCKLLLAIHFTILYAIPRL